MNFVRRLNRGTRKYKGKLLPKYFNCGRIGHYAFKYMYKEGYKRFDDGEKKSRYRRHDFKKRTYGRDKGKEIMLYGDT